MVEAPKIPRVTVICATYNRSNVLPYSVGSVLDQTFSDWEMLVVGDACTDDSAEVIARIKAARDSQDRVRWIDLTPGTGHQYGPNNEGLRQARGDYIAYIGHDDLWLPHHLEVLVAALDGGADLAQSAIYWAHEDKSQLPPYIPQTCDNPVALMHRRALTESVGGWRDYREIVPAPQTELLERLCHNYKRQWVERLTAIKIAAGFRSEVYKTQPTHEQQYWQTRIANEPHLETTLLLDMVDGSMKAYHALRDEMINRFDNRVLRNLKRLLRGQLPKLSKPHGNKPGDFVRHLDKVRGVHGD